MNYFTLQRNESSSLVLSDFMSDVKDECAKYGKVRRVVIPVDRSEKCQGKVRGKPPSPSPLLSPIFPKFRCPRLLLYSELLVLSYTYFSCVPNHCTTR